MKPAAQFVLQARREALGITLTEFARRAGVRRQTVRNIENGTVRYPHRATLAVFARELGLRERDVRKMFEDDE